MMTSTEAFKLITENERLILHTIRQNALGATREELEDVHSQLKIELCERLMRDYDPNRGTKPTTYMALVCRSRALDMIQARKFHASFDGGVDDGEDDDRAPLSNEIGQHNSGVEAFEAREEIRLALSEIDGSLGGAAFALDCFSGDLDTEELAAKYSIAPATVYSRRNKIREFLKSRLSR